MEAHSSSTELTVDQHSVYVSCSFKSINDWTPIDEHNFPQVSFTLRNELIRLGYVKNHKKSKRGSYLEYNYLQCTKPIKQAAIKLYDDNQIYVESTPPCQNRYCFQCADSRAYREIEKIISYLIEVIRKFNCTTAYCFVFSLPTSIASTIFKNKKQEEKIRYKMRDLIHKFMLSRKNVKRMKVPLHESRHLVSSKSLMKIRVHYHYIAISDICVKTINAKHDEYEVITNTMSGSFPQSAFDEINKQWHSYLQKICDEQVKELTRVYIEKKPLKGSTEELINTVRSLLKYTARAFGRDFLKAPLLFHPKRKELIIPDGKTKDKECRHKIVSIKDYVQQWCLVRENRIVNCTGLLHSKERLGKVLGIEFIQEEMTAGVTDVQNGNLITTETHNNSGELRTKKSVYVNSCNGGNRRLASGTYNLGRRGRKRYWATKTV